MLKKTEKQGGSEYIPAYDAARLIAVLAVIWIHAAINVNSSLSDDPSFLGRFGLAFFIIGSVYFTTVGIIENPRLSFFYYIFKRFRRLYLLFFVWSGVYLILKDIEGAILGGDTTLKISPIEFLFEGGAYHLWFLPFIFCANVITFLIIKGVLRISYNVNFVCILFLLFGLLITQAPTFIPTSFFDQPTVFNWWFSLPSVFWAMAYALRSASSLVHQRTDLNMPLITDRRDTVKIVVISGLLLCVLLTVVGFFNGPRSLLANLAGFCFALVTMSGVKNPSIEQIAVFGKLSYGIFLAHLIFIGFARVTAYKLGGNDTTWTFAILSTGISFVASITLAFLLTKWRYTAWLVK